MLYSVGKNEMQVKMILTLFDSQLSGLRRSRILRTIQLLLYAHSYFYVLTTEICLWPIIVLES